MSRAERDLDDEVAGHLAEAEADYVARGLSRQQAREAALRDFGGVTQVKQVHREMRSFTFMNWLDFKLGGRMLVKYPGLTVVGGLAMAFAILVGIVIFQFAALFLYPSLPLPNGDRIVQLNLHDIVENQTEDKALYDFLSWRESLRTITNLGAWRDSIRTLIVLHPSAQSPRAGGPAAEGDARPAFVAEMSSPGFAVASGQPLMGRVFTPDDEKPASPAVAVIGYELWQTRFGKDPNVLGRAVQLGADHLTIVGVMREGFAFPVSHEMWVPLKTAVLDQAPRSGPAITIFGTLAEGETIETAQAELTTHGRRAAVEQKPTHEHLEPRVAKYADMMAMNGGEDAFFMLLIYGFIGMLVVLMCGNVGLLLFARAASRESDLVVRTALGASRGRIVSQLFAEALVLGGLAAVVGVAGAAIILRNWAMTFLQINLGRLPFWFDLSLSPATIAAAIVLTVLAATVAGVMPALKITRRMSDRLKQTTAGSGGLRFGGVWTVIIVAQVAVTVVFPAIVWFENVQLGRMQDFNPGFSTEQFLAVSVERDAPVDHNATLDAANVERNARMTATLGELRTRIAAQPGVAGVTFVETLPGGESPERRIEMGYDAAEAASRDPEASAPIRYATVVETETNYFDVVGAPILAGRGFNAADAQPGANVVIVDRAFVANALHGRNPIGQQVRLVRPGNPAGPTQWYSVVGLVDKLDSGVPYRKGPFAGLYLPGTPERFDAVHMLIRVRGGDPMTLAPPVREFAAAVDPSLRLVQIQRVNELADGMVWIIRLWMSITFAMSSVALLLSLAGLYSVMAFTVTRRTREIGVRVALGGSRQRILVAIFRRPLIQMGLGVLAGISFIAFMTFWFPYTDGPGAGEAEGLTLWAIAMQGAYATVMLGVCMLACVVPTRRALNVEPTVALRTE
ncbi:MAG TPA: ABC transporter permease [Vicinamibacterales bacterium]|nr:ABC transporter permease [Vicinamibacterales bacterium]